MSRSQVHRIQVPDELREVLLEFTINYLLEQPGDIVTYAVEYFTRVRDARTTAIDGAVSSPDESVQSHEEGKFSIIYL